MKKISYMSLLLLTLALLIVTACSPGGEQPAEDAENVAQAATLSEAQEEKAVPIEVAVIESGDISLVINYSGSLEPKDEVDIAPGASGQIEEVLVEVGDTVSTGDPIAVIKDDTYLTQIKQAEAALENAQLSLAKMELGSRPEEIAAAQAAVELAKASLNDIATVDDNERTQAASNLARAQAALKSAQTEYDKIAWAGEVGATPQAMALQEATIAYETALAAYNQQTNPSDSQLAPLMLQVAQAELQLALTIQPFRQIDFAQAQVAIKQAEAGLEAARLQLEDTVIVAPFDGVIADVNISVGSRVGPQAPVAHLISEALEARIEVQESAISQVEDGQSASLQVTAYPGQDFPGVVTSVSPAADPKSRTFAVRVTPVEGQELLRSGMFANLDILAQENKNTVLAPREAIVHGENEPFVYIVMDDNTVEERTITTGLYDQNRIEILQGLQPGDVVVVAGQSSLEDGSKTEITNDPRIAE
jgi:HlyD family secretion protein